MQYAKIKKKIKEIKSTSNNTVYYKVKVLLHKFYDLRLCGISSEGAPNQNS